MADARRPSVAELGVAFITPYSLKEPEWIPRILELWKETAPELYPEFADYKEPVRRPLPEVLTDEDVNRLAGGWLARRRTPRLGFQCESNTFWHAGAWLSVKSGPPDRFVTPVVAWSDRMADALGVDFGYVHVLTDNELKAEPHRRDICRPRRDGSDAGATITVMAGATLTTGIPTLYWRTYFGSLYVDLIGAAVIEAVPAYRIERHNWGYVIQLTEDPPGKTPWEEFAAARDRAIAALGSDLFNGRRTVGEERTEPPPRVPNLHGTFRTKPLADHEASSKPSPRLPGVELPSDVDPNTPGIEDLRALAQPLVAIAKRMVATAGEFYPVGDTMNADGTVALLGSSTGAHHPDSSELLDLLVGAMGAQAAGSDIRAIGLCSDARQRGEDGEIRTAIVVSLEHRIGSSIAFVLPYKFDPDVGALFGTSELIAPTRRVFRGDDRAP